MKGHAICKDCGNATLSNAINEQFILVSDADVAVCKRCGSSHIDGELYLEEV
jgi:ribosomal protein L32